MPWEWGCHSVVRFDLHNRDAGCIPNTPKRCGVRCYLVFVFRSSDGQGDQLLLATESQVSDVVLPLESSGGHTRNTDNHHGAAESIAVAVVRELSLFTP